MPPCSKPALSPRDRVTHGTEKSFPMRHPKSAGARISNKTRHLNRGKIIHRHTPSRAHKIDTTPHVGACIEHRKKGLNCPIIPKALSGYTVVSEGVYEKIR